MPSRPRWTLCGRPWLARASRILERATGELSLAHYRVLAAVASGEERASRLAVRSQVRDLPLKLRHLLPDRRLSRGELLYPGIAARQHVPQPRIRSAKARSVIRHGHIGHAPHCTTAGGLRK